MEKIGFRPQNVRETLIELKDSSELAVDLAYAAVLYGHSGLADEVFDLESDVNSLQYPAQIALMLAAKRADDAERLVGIIQIVNAAVTITNAAADIAGIVREGIGLPDEVRSALPEADEVVMRGVVTDDSEVVGRSLGELSLETEMGVQVTAINRDSKWIIAPDDDIIVRGGDIVIGAGPEDGVADVYALLTGETWSREMPSRRDVEELQRAAETVIQLKNIAELTVGLSYSAVLFDDADLAREVNELESLSDQLKGDIETWVIEAGEHVGTPTQLRGLLHLATASEVICDAGQRIAEIVLREGEVHPVFQQAVSESDEVITTFRVARGSQLAGTSLGAVELEEQSGMSVMAIDRADEWILAPIGDTELRAGDVLIARGPHDGLARLAALAGGPS